MEADWSIDLAGDDPVILVPWKASWPTGGFIDLRENSQAIDEIEEAQRAPALRSALLNLNDARSRLWTAKCDVWQAGPDDEDDEIDPLEMEAAPEEAKFSAGSYIDLLQRDIKAGESFEMQEHWIRSVTERLRSGDLRCARTDFVLRRAQLWGRAGFGVTWYARGCGASPERAAIRWAEALAHALRTVIQEPCL